MEAPGVGLIDIRVAEVFPSSSSLLLSLVLFPILLGLALEVLFIFPWCAANNNSFVSDFVDFDFGVIIFLVFTNSLLIERSIFVWEDGASSSSMDVEGDDGLMN